MRNGAQGRIGAPAVVEAGPQPAIRGRHRPKRACSRPVSSLRRSIWIFPGGGGATGPDPPSRRGRQAPHEGNEGCTRESYAAVIAYGPVARRHASRATGLAPAHSAFAASAHEARFRSRERRSADAAAPFCRSSDPRRRHLSADRISTAWPVMTVEWRAPSSENVRSKSAVGRQERRSGGSRWLIHLVRRNRRTWLQSCPSKLFIR